MARKSPNRRRVLHRRASDDVLDRGRKQRDRKRKRTPDVCPPQFPRN